MKSESLPPERIQFPADFGFGVADADLQVISEDLTLSREGSQPTSWLSFARENFAKIGGTTEHSIDRYSIWPEDLQLIAGLGIKHYRTSVSMARLLMPDGSPNAKAVRWYRDYFSALRSLRVRIYATLYHWELPEAAQRRGGWRNRRIVDDFARHCSVAADELGDLIDEYFLLNEPWCIAALSHHQGVHAPGERTVRGMLEAAHHVLLAIAAGHEVLCSRLQRPLVSTVFNVESYYSCSDSDADRRALQYADGYFNRWFLDPLYRGAYPDDMCELYGQHLPHFAAADMQALRIGDQLHALGLNYYSGALIGDPRSCRTAPWKELDIEGRKIANFYKCAGAPESDLGWPILLAPWYGAGYQDALATQFARYRECGLSRIYLTENGIGLASAWDGRSEAVSDAVRIAYLQEHLMQARRCLDRGIPIEKYFCWTLCDNFEWAEGYRPQSCFGLVHVDRSSLRRVPKRSYRWYRDLVASGGFNLDPALHLGNPALPVRRSCE